MAEKKNANKNIAKVVKDTNKAKNVKEVKQEVICNCSGNKAILNRIYYCLLVIVVITALILVTLIIKGSNNNSTNNSNGSANETSEGATGEYDVSMFDTLSTNDTLEQIKDGKKHIVYIGRSTCGYCVKFLPTLQQAQKEYGYKTIYINLEEMTSDDQKNILTVDNDEKYIEENLGYTPMVLIFEDGKLKKGWVGYSEYDQFASFLEENGYSK